MNWKALLALFAIGFGIYAYIHFGIERPAEEKAEKEEREALLIQGPLESLKQINIKKSDGNRVELKIIDRGYWYVQKPFKDLARMSQIENIYKALKETKIEKVLFEGKESFPDLSAFGLDEKRQSALSILRTSIGEEETIRLGRRNPEGKLMYALLEKPARVVLLTTELEFIKSDQARDYREMKLANVEVDNFEEIEIEKRFRGRTAERVHLKREGRVWRMTSPDNLPLDQDETLRLLKKLPIIRASKFLEEFPKPLRMPSLKVTALFKENIKDPRSDTDDELGQGIRIEMAREVKKGRKNPGPDDFTYYAVSDKTPPAQIARFHYDNFSKDWKSLVRKNFDYFLSNDVLELSVSSKSESFQLVKQSDGIKFKDGSRLEPASHEAWDKALKQIRRLRATSFVKSLDQLPERSEAQHSILITLNSGDGFELLLEESDEPSKLFVKDAEGRILEYELPAKAFRAQSFQKLSFRKPATDS